MKILVAHPAQQHSFRLATALKQNDCLFKYCTTVYLKDKSLTKLLMRFLPKKFRIRAESRICEELKDSDVMQFCEIEGLFRLLAQNVKFLNKYHNKVRYHVSDRFAKKVAKYAIKNNVDMVITYDDCSPLLFEILKEKAPHIKRILDTSAANRLYMKEIYESDIQITPEFAEHLRKEVPQVWDREILNRVKRELNASQQFLVPSDFVSRSLKYSGILEKQILLCPYGVDIREFTLKTYDKKENKKVLKFIYVGGWKQLKGISYLFEAFRNIPKEKATLIVVGDFSKSYENFEKYVDYITFVGRIPHSQISEILYQSDVFIMPSLGDSFALSALEAAACGLPLIVSKNTGILDLMTEGKEGFMIPIQSSKALEEKINWFIENAEKIPQMGIEARKMAEKYTWQRYYKCVSDIVLKFL